MRKVDDGEKRKEKKRKKEEKRKEKRMSFLVATTSLPAVDRPNDDRRNAVRSRQFYFYFFFAKSSRIQGGEHGKENILVARPKPLINRNCGRNP